MRQQHQINYYKRQQLAEKSRGSSLASASAAAGVEFGLQPLTDEAHICLSSWILVLFANDSVSRNRKKHLKIKETVEHIKWEAKKIQNDKACIYAVSKNRTKKRSPIKRKSDIFLSLFLNRAVLRQTVIYSYYRTVAKKTG